MPVTILALTVLSIALGPLLVAADAPQRIACVGDSITQGVGAAPDQSWPNALKGMLGARAGEVGNFGRSGATLLKAGDLPYRDQPEFAAANAFKPTLVLIMLGTNDTKPHNWDAHGDDFATDLADLVAHFRALPSKPNVALMLPPSIYPNGFGIREEIVTGGIIPRVQAVAAKLAVPVFDVHGATAKHPEWFPDGVHPNADGMAAIARAAADGLSGKPAKPKR